MKFLKSVLIVSAMFFVFNVSAAPAVTGSNPDFSLYYSFDDLANSSFVADNRYVGALQGSFYSNNTPISPVYISTATSSGDPFKGKAASLDGTKYIKMGGTYPLHSLGASGDHEITISLWVKFSNSAPNGNDCFIAKNTDAGGDKFLFGVWSSQIMVRINSNYRLQTYVDGTNGSTINVYNGAWHHFAVAIKEDSANPGTSKVTLWIDGSKKWNNLTISNILSDSDMTTGQIPSIGMDLDGTGLDKTDLLEGYVDELQIFSAVGNDTDAANLYNGRFGVPFDFDVWTSSIEDYSPSGSGGSDVNGPHDNSDGFLYNAYTSMNNYSYEYLEYPVSTFAHVAHDDDVLIGNPLGSGWLTSSSQSSYEVVFHAGHGHPKGIRDWYFSNILLSSNYSYSGSTRWVFYDSCSTMKPVAHGTKPCKRGGTTINSEPCCSNSEVDDICYGAQVQPWPLTYFYDNENVGLNWFGDRFDSTSGPHAIMGFASIMWFTYDSQNNNSAWSANNYSPTQSDFNKDGYDDDFILFDSILWSNIVLENFPIWEAYKDAVERKLWNSQWRHSVEATIAYKEDSSTGFNGSEEQWNSTYRNGSTSSMSFGMDTEVFKICLNPPTCDNLENPTYREDWR